MSWFVQTLAQRGLNVPQTFVETGAYMGEGIRNAVRSRHLTAIHSIELSPQWVTHCRNRFARYRHVHVHEGDSAQVLAKLFETQELPASPVIFYLDAHYSGGPTAGSDVDNGCPVLRELETIAKRNVDGDVVFVDDMRLMGKESWSGAVGGTVYPYTKFDFRHVTDESIERALCGRAVTFREQFESPDRLLLVLGGDAAGQ